MHALVAPVLLRVAWLDAFDADTEAQPPHREFGEAEEGGAAGKRDAIVGADGCRQSEVFEGSLEGAKSKDFLGALQGIAAQQVPARRVGDGEGVTIALVGEHELALVIGAPKIIGCASRLKDRSLGLIAVAPATPIDQAMAIQDRVDGANGRQVDLGVLAPQLLADLRSAPAGMFAPELHDELLDLEG